MQATHKSHQCPTSCHMKPPPPPHTVTLPVFATRNAFDFVKPTTTLPKSATCRATTYAEGSFMVPAPKPCDRVAGLPRGFPSPLPLPLFPSLDLIRLAAVASPFTEAAFDRRKARGHRQRECRYQRSAFTSNMTSASMTWAQGLAKLHAWYATNQTRCRID